MERIMYKTPAFDSFYNSLNIRARKRVDYVFEHIRTEKNISTKFVKSLVNTDFYEMRISVDNEYRVIFFSIDNDNFISGHIADNHMILKYAIWKSRVPTGITDNHTSNSDC